MGVKKMFKPTICHLSNLPPPDKPKMHNIIGQEEKPNANMLKGGC